MSISDRLCILATDKLSTKKSISVVIALMSDIYYSLSNHKHLFSAQVRFVIYCSMIGQRLVLVVMY